ncbi:hypothetical protein HDV05_005518 [Chytridiales sp. JEL 0842]|nr:hypothetical protein HDV05_005518 [Chytridiales sp. JEL 0842]
MSPPTSTTPLPTDKRTFYKELINQVISILDETLPPVSNLANVSALVYWALNDPPVSRKVNWVGFYLTDKTESPSGKKKMTLGPFQGRVACTMIPFGKGVCGTAAAEQRTIVVKNVHDFPGHIACDSASESEIVVPVIVDGQVVGVFDLDCLVVNGYDEDDRVGLEAIVAEVVKVVPF